MRSIDRRLNIILSFILFSYILFGLYFNFNNSNINQTEAPIIQNSISTSDNSHTIKFTYFARRTDKEVQIDQIEYPISKVQNQAGEIITISIDNITDKVEVPINYDFIGYAFEWNSGSFEYSWDGEIFQKVTNDSSHAKDTDSKLFSDIYFDTSDTSSIFLKNNNATQIDLILVNPADVEIPQYKTSSFSAQEYTGATYTDLNIVSRSDWGADENLAFWNPSYIEPIRIVVHHTVNNNSSSDYPAIVRSIYLYHAVTRNWGDIGYNYLIDQNGVIYEGRKGGDGVVGAHVLGINYESIGIGMIGTFTDELPAAPARVSLKNLIAEKAAIHGIVIDWGTTLNGHRDFSITECPGDTFYNYLYSTEDEINDKVHGLSNMRAALSLADQMINASRVNGELNYGDIILEFDREESVSESEILQLIPQNSAIEIIKIDGNIATLRIKRYYNSEGEFLPYRNRYLITYFNLHPDVRNIYIGGYSN